ncbi:hypothetical protein [Cryptosporangium aurantiacum]|uniref:Uncharacterized protein n=1 Tax=Cryptosporangium aurantiacum TaxID=134849 RepID=A0A1M7RM83_9ACTN|nr:hypothetical protein [Cryptosporangium aurantiacum]SHN47364.1 hypothetical protein SAMN05443668_12310 [Cryptosporangium aurantiacum]
MSADSVTGASYVDRRLAGGSAVLLTGGLLACLAGATLGMVAVVNGCRRYVADLKEPPSVTARRRLGQARSATVAGVEAWRHYGGQQARA